MQQGAVMIMAGGTGGHVYPALAVADAMRARGTPVCWLGTGRGLEAAVIPEHGIALHTLNITGIRGKGVLRTITAPVQILIAVCQAVRLFVRLKPAAVLGMGGFVSGPGGLAAWLLRIPLYIHEQNRIAGLSNKLLAPLARYVFQGFADSFPGSHDNHRLAAKLITVGNPVRSAIARLPDPEQRRVGNGNTIKVLVLGGSQGAAALNRIVPAALAAVSASHRLEIWHQCGADKYADCKAIYKKLKLDNVHLDGFIEEMAAAYGWADIAICRAGALTIAELCAAGLGAILIPYPHAVDDHQLHNACYLLDAHAAVLCREEELDIVRLQSMLLALCKDKQTFLNMARNSRALARVDAAAVVADYCMGLRT